MPKGYLVARVEVTDPDQYALYAKAAGQAIASHGGRVLARGGRMRTVEGEGRPRNVIIEFDSFDKAVDYYYSDDYQAARALRETAGVGDFVVVEGVD